MGTLTADCPRLDTHCPHKLATSCRLTSVPKCCACADERLHSHSYSVYIDGVGFVQRGTRWQSYCWFCKEFWTNRLAATDPPLNASQTRLPDIPDQTEFLERWFEFYQGYRIVKNSEGVESRIAVIGEPFREVSPGFLPRTLDQLRAGAHNDASRSENIFRRRRLSEEERERPEEPRQTLEETLDSLLEEATDDEATSATEQEQELQQTIDDMPRRSTGLSRPLSRAEVGLQRARDRFTRLFGTREDVQRDDYESPLARMYNTAWDRYRQAEQRRSTSNPTEPSDIEQRLLFNVLEESRRSFHQRIDSHHVSRAPSSSATTAASRDSNNNNAAPTQQQDPSPTTASSSTPSDGGAPSDTSTQAVHNGRNPQDTPSHPSNSDSTTTSSSSNNSNNVIPPTIEQITTELSRLRVASEAMASARLALHSRPGTVASPLISLDNQPNRPPPATEAQMTKKLECQVCYSQVADVALLPCGHMVMCEWCADVVVPVKHTHVPVGVVKCPMCRKNVKQRFKIHMG